MLLAKLIEAMERALENCEVVEIRVSSTVMRQLTEKLPVCEQKPDCISAVFGVPVTTDNNVPDGKMWVMTRKVSRLLRAT